MQHSSAPLEFAKDYQFSCCTALGISPQLVRSRSRSGRRREQDSEAGNVSPPAWGRDQSNANREHPHGQRKNTSLRSHRRNALDRAHHRHAQRTSLAVPGTRYHGYSSIRLPIPLQVALLVTPLLGVIIAWRWEQIGGALLVACVLLFWTLPPIADGRIPTLTTGDLILFPGLLAGMLFLICRSRTKPQTPTTPTSNDGNKELHCGKST